MIKKLLGDSAIYGLSSIIARLISVFLVPIYTRIYSPDDYGILAKVNNLVGLLTIVMVLSLDAAASRWFYDKEDKVYQKKVLSTWFWACMISSSLLTIGLMLAGPMFCAHVVGRPDSLKLVIMASLTLPLSFSLIYTTNVLRFMQKPVATTVFSLGNTLLLVSMNILFIVVLKKGLLGVYYAQIITGIVTLIATFFMLHQWIGKPYINKELIRDMLKYSFPLIPGTIAFWVVNATGVYFLPKLQEAGLYNIGNSVAMGMALFTGAFQMSWGPFVFANYKKESAPATFASIFLLFIAFSGLLSIGLCLFGREVLSILTTHEYLNADWVSGILSINYIITGLNYIASAGLNIAKNNNSYGVSMIISAVLLIVLNLVMVPVWGKEGAALAAVLSQVIVPVIMFYYAQKLYPFPYNFKKAGVLLVMILVFAFGGKYYIEHLFGFRNLLSVSVKILLCLVYLLAGMYLVNGFSHIKRIFLTKKIATGK